MSIFIGLWQRIKMLLSWGGFMEDWYACPDSAKAHSSRAHPKPFSLEVAGQAQSLPRLPEPRELVRSSSHSRQTFLNSCQLAIVPNRSVSVQLQVPSWGLPPLLKFRCLRGASSPCLSAQISLCLERISPLPLYLPFPLNHKLKNVIFAHNTTQQEVFKGLLLSLLTERFGLLLFPAAPLPPPFLLFLFWSGKNTLSGSQGCLKWSHL